ncbi:hypothetical protein [Microbispora rosea]|uniref:hypothetical protein n=1 Tax=Microbispora rosea TaxID=58117 RepID=UPI0004C43AEB|nr:hypothetical protein [Microbispora rosea]
MGWISPRKDAEHAKTVAERMARDYEEQLGRPLTPDELREVHEEAERTVKSWGERAREAEPDPQTDTDR